MCIRDRPEVVEDGKTGFVVDTESAMVQAVSKLETIDRNACRTAVETRFSIAKMIDGYEAVYANIMKK